ncbi:MAG: sulfatase-like hydrolase/transferase, partial [Bacteroidota bacterium]
MPTSLRISFACFCFILPFCSLVFAQKKPNIIILYADDISARELPIYGSDVWSAPKGGELKGGDTQDHQYRAQTPVIDQMARSGCYVETAWASTICGPSRAMLMAGRYAHLHKWWHNKDKGRAPSGEGTWRIYESSPHTIAHVAKKGGYATYWAGKTQMEDVLDFGFDEGCFTPGQGSYNQAIPTTDFRLESRKVDGQRRVYNADTDTEVNNYVQSGWYWYPHVQLMNHPEASQALEWWPNNQAARDTFGLSTFGPDVELSYTFDFMERKQATGEPFFIYHTSHLGHDAFDFFHPHEGNKWPGTPIVTWDGQAYTRTKPKVSGDRGVYETYGSITEDGIHNHINYLDYQVWLYLNKLQELGIADNTIFIFCADNGTSGYGKGSVQIQRGTHVPLIIYAPGLSMT